MILLKYHIIIHILFFILILFLCREKSKILFYLFPGSFILFSGPFIFFLIYYVSKKEKDHNPGKFELVDVNKDLFNTRLNTIPELTDLNLLYIYQEKILKEEGAFYYIKNLSRKSKVESKVISAGVYVDAEVKILDKIMKFKKKYAEKKTFSSAYNIALNYYDYSMKFFEHSLKDYFQDNLKDYFLRKGLEYLLEQEIDQRFNHGNLLLGKIYYRLGDLVKSEKYFDDYINNVRDKTSEHYYTNLINIYFIKKEYKKIERVFKWFKKQDEIPKDIQELIDLW